MNFTEQILSMGYERFIPDYEKIIRRQVDFNASNGWLGLTTYHPYERFVKDNKVVELDLSRYGVKNILFTSSERIETDINEKSIKITIDGEVVYHNIYGVIPNDKIIELL